LRFLLIYKGHDKSFNSRQLHQMQVKKPLGLTT